MAESGHTTRIAPTGSTRETAAWLAELIAESDARTILHTHFTRFDLPAMIAARSRPGTIVFWHLHTFLAPGTVTRLRNSLKYGVLSRQVNGVICAAPWLAESTRRRGAPTSRVIVLPNGIDTNRFRVADESARTRERQRLSLRPDGPMLLHFAWDWEVKGGDLFLAAMGQLREAGSEAWAVIVGSKARAEAERNRLGLGDCVDVLEPRDAVKSLYAAANVFVSASVDEGLPFAILEALASGRPVVATDIPAHRAIGAGLEAYRLAAPTPSALATAVGSLIDQPAGELERTTEAAAGWVQENRSLDTWAQELLAIYANALAKAA